MPMKSRAEYTITNRIYWNEVASVHQDNYVNDLLQRIGDPDFTTFDPIEQKLFNLKPFVLNKITPDPFCK